MIRKLFFVLSALIGGAAYAVTVPVASTDQTITPNSTACFTPTNVPAQFMVDATGNTYKCVSGKWQRWDMPPCPANPPTGAAPGGTTGQPICKRTDTGAIYGADGSGNWTSLSGSGATVSGATDGLVQIKSGSALTTAPGFSASASTGAVTAKILNTTIEVAQYASGGTGTSGSPYTSASGTGGLAEAAAACPQDSGSHGTNCKLHLSSATFQVAAKTTFGAGVFIEGNGVNSSIISAAGGFSGSSILEWKNTTGSTFNGTIVPGAGGRNFTVQCNGVSAHGIDVFKGYDGVTFDTVSIQDVGSAFNGIRFEPNTAYSDAVSQTVSLNNVYTIHKNGGAGAPVCYFEAIQEGSFNTVKCLGGYAANAPSTGDVAVFKDNRGLAVTNLSVAGSSGSCIHVLSSGANNFQTIGVYFYGTTIEACTTSATVEGTGAYYAQDVNFYGVRNQSGIYNSVNMTDGPFVFKDVARAYADIPAFTATVDANCSDVRLHLSDAANLASDAGTRTLVDADYDTRPIGAVYDHAFNASLLINSAASGGPQIRFGQSARTQKDYWRLLWSANASNDFGFQIGYQDASNVFNKYIQIGGLSNSPSTDINFYNAGTQALRISNGGTIPRHGNGVPASCTNDEIYICDNCTAGQRWYTCEGGLFHVEGDGGGAGALTVNGLSPTSTANLANNGSITWSLSDPNIFGFIANGAVTDQQVNSSAGIALSKLATFSSAQLFSQMTTKTGTGNAVFGTGPTIASPSINGFTASKCARFDATGTLVAATGDCTTGGGGTVSSVGLALPTDFTVTNSPVTASGTLTGAWAAKAANLVMAGPVNGGAATPSFRFLNVTDIPAMPGTAGFGGGVPPPISSDISGNKVLRADGTWVSQTGTVGVQGTPVLHQLTGWFDATHIEGLTSMVFTDTGDVTVNSLTTADPGNGSRRLRLLNNASSDVADPGTTYAAIYAKGGTAPADDALPYWRNHTNGVIKILNDRGGDYGDFTCSAGTCTVDAGTVTTAKMAATAVTPASYTNTNLTVDAAGRITAASNGTGATTTSTATYFIDTPVTGDSGKEEIQLPQASTITRVSCSTNVSTSTATINIDKRAETTPDTSGTNVLSAGLVCDTNAQTSCASGCDVNTITSSAVTARQQLTLTISAVANAPTALRVFVEYTTP